MRVAVKHRAFFYVSLPIRADPPHAGSHSPLRRCALAMTPQRHRGHAAIASRSWREGNMGSIKLNVAVLIIQRHFPEFGKRGLAQEQWRLNVVHDSGLHVF